MAECLDSCFPGTWSRVAAPEMGRPKSSGIHLVWTADKQLQGPSGVGRVGVLLSGMELFNLKGKDSLKKCIVSLEVAEGEVFLA